MARRQVLGTVLIREALRALARHKLRTALTTLGVTIGTAAVVLVVAVSEAGVERAREAFRALGDNLVWLEAGGRNIAGVRTGNHGTTSLTVEDAEAIANEVPLVHRLSPQIDGSVQIVAPGRNWYTRFRGETPDYLAIKQWTIAQGAMFSHLDVEGGARKVVLGATVARELFSGLDPVGEVVRMRGQPFDVVGVLEGKGMSASGQDQDDWILLPYTTAGRVLRGGAQSWLDDILCSARSTEDVEPATDRIIALMRDRHHIRAGEEDDFNIRRPGELLKAELEASHTFAALLIAVAAVSLVIGGIGIMNVMLAAVAQRSREIGLRLAVGATEGEVQAQFLGEAVILSLIGGGVGLLVSIGAAIGYEPFWGAPIPIPPSAVALAVASSTAVGILFGYYPARRAARLDPIEVLRRE